jgi:alpha-L-rhamnosidase
MASHPPTRLRCEYFTAPVGLGEAKPRLSWELVDDRRGARQSAYRILVASTAAKLAAGEGDLWDSGRSESDQTAQVEYDGAPLASRQSCHWQVMAWDGDGVATPWSEPAFWEIGLLDASDWQAEWIGLPPRASKDSEPAAYLRREFVAEKPVRQARLYVSARGSYECYLNGQRVGDDHFTPGWTDYARRIPYQAYDVTDRLQEGGNALGGILGEGWYSGYLIWKNNRNIWGDNQSLLAQLEVEYTDGSRAVIASDASWHVATGPIRKSDHYNGETYDARLETPGWDTPGFAAPGWQPVHVYEPPPAPLVAKPGPNVRKIMELEPKELTEPTPGTFIFDLGQNMVGWAKLRFAASAGTEITIRYGEMLQDDGTLYTENLRSAECTDRYICKGGGEVYEPTFTFHGFRYLELTGCPTPPTLATVTGVVLHSDAPKTGSFACSNELLNQLQSNILWGQRGNFFEVPTDCPQRDERLGWTGDAQIFVRTACFNLDVAAFFTKWMFDLVDAQDEEGRFPNIAPKSGLKGEGVAAWADAGVICPWTIHLCYGDTRLLDRHFDAMARWVRYMERTSKDLIRPAMGFGDWLAIDAPTPGGSPTPKELIGTAYFHRCAAILAKAAARTGRDRDAEDFAALAERVKAAFNREFVTPAGRVAGNSQTSYLLALGFDLLPEEIVPLAADRLVADLERRGWHLSTGFVGTPLLAPVLTKVGRTDAAYKLVLQDTYPSWLYPILQGATTMWERWNSYTKEHGFGDVSMNSFNHYGYGSVGEWLYATVAGIDVDETAPGYKRLVLRPEPGGGLTWATGGLQTMHGAVRVAWKIANGQLHYTLTIPPNTTAELRLPVTGAIVEGGIPIAEAEGITNVTVQSGRTVCQLVAGTYEFQAAWQE